MLTDASWLAVAFVLMMALGCLLSFLGYDMNNMTVSNIGNLILGSVLGFVLALYLTGIDFEQFLELTR